MTSNLTSKNSKENVASHFVTGKFIKSLKNKKKINSDITFINIV